MSTQLETRWSQGFLPMPDRTQHKWEAVLESLRIQEQHLKDTQGLLADLDGPHSERYPSLSRTQALIKFKQAELCLRRAWEYWHHDGGDLRKAAEAFGEFLSQEGAPDFFVKKKDDVLRYTKYLLRALIDERDEHTFKRKDEQSTEGKDQPPRLPPWIEKFPALKNWLTYYEEIRDACQAYGEGNWSDAYKTAQRVAEDKSAELWMRQQARELWAETAREPDSSSHNCMVIDILDGWLRLFEESENPLELARRAEGNLFYRRAARLRETLISWVHLCWVGGYKTKVNKVVAWFEQEKLDNVFLDKDGLTLGVIRDWASRKGSPGGERLVYEYTPDSYSDLSLSDIRERWRDAYTRWRGRFKAVLVSHYQYAEFGRTEESKDRGEFESKDDLDWLVLQVKQALSQEPDLDYWDISAHKTSRVKKDCDPEKATTWLWFKPKIGKKPKDFERIRLAVEMRKSRFKSEGTWYCHTLVELHPSRWSLQEGTINKALETIQHDRDGDLKYCQLRLFTKIKSTFDKIQKRNNHDRQSP